MKAKVFGLDKLGKPNLNGRIYPQEVVKKALQKWNEFIKDNRGFICLGPPENDTVDLTTVIGLVKKTEFKDHVLYVEMQPLKVMVNNSKEIWNMFRKKKLIVSMAGLATIKDNGNDTYTVQDDLEIISFYLNTPQ